MSRLEELKEQRKKLTEEIKFLESRQYTEGNAKMELVHYPRGSEWRVSVFSSNAENLDKNRWRCIASDRDKHGALMRINKAIADLITLRETVEKSIDEDN